ncbi:MAG TPA: hypothetical protein VG937_10670 [Polyangiaceae bacterium]|nr:hypothetical protein [Polyangiaceae bacterium]
MASKTRYRAAALLVAGSLATPGRALAFKEQGHRSIEAAAYRNLIDQGQVDVLITLVNAGILSGRVPSLRPDGIDEPTPYASANQGDEQVDGIFLGSHQPDHSFAHQLQSYGQCYHFMARPSDVYTTDVDPRTQLPAGLVKNAYSRCMGLLDTLIRGILFDPDGSRRRGAGAYTLIHIVEDSFSEAHVARTSDWKIVYLKPWRLTAWWPYMTLHHSGLRYYVSESHHGGCEDERDFGYLNYATCKAHEAELVSVGCLSSRGLKAADAIAELLVLLAKHADCSNHPRATMRTCAGFDKNWNDYKFKYFAHQNPSVSAVYTGEEAAQEFVHGVGKGDLIGPSDSLDHPAQANLGVGLATDFADSAESLWLTGDVFVTRDPMKAHEIAPIDLLAYSLQVRLPLQDADGAHPAGAAGEVGLRIPFNFLSEDAVPSDVASLYLGFRARGAVMASYVTGDRTRFVGQFGFGGFTADLVLFQRVWLGVEGPRALMVYDSLGPDVYPPFKENPIQPFWTVKAGFATNALP